MATTTKWAAIAVLLSLSGGAFADDLSEIRLQNRELRKAHKALEKRLKQFEKRQAAQPARPEPAQAPERLA